MYKLMSVYITYTYNLLQFVYVKPVHVSILHIQINKSISAFTHAPLYTGVRLYGNNRTQVLPQ